MRLMKGMGSMYIGSDCMDGKTNNEYIPECCCIGCNKRGAYRIGEYGAYRYYCYAHAPKGATNMDKRT